MPKAERERERERERAKLCAMEVERVQAIASLSLTTDTIPAEFIRPEKEQPAITTFRGPVPEIPTIDLSDPDQENLVRSIANASKEWGIFQVVNHGVPTDVITKLQAVGKEFFELPPEKKEVYAKIPGSQSIEGYGTQLQKDIDGKKPWVDHLFHKIWPPSTINYRFWPKNPPSYRFLSCNHLLTLKYIMNSKPEASLSVDLKGLWLNSYLLIYNEA